MKSFQPEGCRAENFRFPSHLIFLVRYDMLRPEPIKNLMFRPRTRLLHRPYPILGTRTSGKSWPSGHSKIVGGNLQNILFAPVACTSLGTRLEPGQDASADTMARPGPYWPALVRRNCECPLFAESATPFVGPGYWQRAAVEVSAEMQREFALQDQGSDAKE